MTDAHDPTIGGEDDATGEKPTASGGASAAGTSAAGEDLLAAASHLGSADDQGQRSRSGTVRRRQRVVRGGTEAAEPLGDASEPERAKVRSSAEEGPSAPPPVDAGGRPTEAGGAQAGSGMLDANGRDIADRDGSVPPEDRVAAAPAAEAPASGATIVDTAVFLADAVRSYLDGVDAYGVTHAVTQDRLDRLRRTLTLWDHERG